MGKEPQFDSDVECARRHEAQPEGMQSLRRIRRCFSQAGPPGVHSPSCILLCAASRPENGETVMSEQLIVGDERELLGLGLCDQHAGKRVVMVSGEAYGSQSMRNGDGEGMKAIDRK